MPPRLHLVLWLSVTGIVVGCSRREAVAPRPIVVLAASSTTESLREIAEAFEAAHEGQKVELMFAGSQALRLQIEQGAPSDVIVTANELHLGALASQGLVSQVEPFATNELVVIVPEENPAGLQTFDDLPNAERIVIGAAAVPVGAYTERLFDHAAGRWGPTKTAKLRGHVVSKEANVRLVRAKVDLGEADAAIVYLTDGLGREGVRMIRIPEDLNVRAHYFVGQVVRTDAHSATGAWIHFLRSERARGILARHGFGADDD